MFKSTIVIMDSNHFYEWHNQFNILIIQCDIYKTKTNSFTRQCLMDMSLKNFFLFTNWWVFQLKNIDAHFIIAMRYVKHAGTYILVLWYIIGRDHDHLEYTIICIFFNRLNIFKISLFSFSNQFHDIMIFYLIKKRPHNWVKNQ